MTSQNRQRASRNRTLTVSADEVPRLDAMITSCEDFVSRGYEDDCLINSDLSAVIDAISDGYFDLIIIDPPYNLDKDFNGMRFAAMSGDAYEEYLRTWFYKVCDKLSPVGSLYMCGDWKCSSSMQRVISERLTIINRITWQREKGRGAKTNWKNSMEDIWFAVKNSRQYYFDVDAVKVKRRVLAPYRENGAPKDWEETESGNFRNTYPSNFWDDISVPFWSMPENTDHPTQKPEKLYAKLILASTKPGDRIFARSSAAALQQWLRVNSADTIVVSKSTASTAVGRQNVLPMPLSTPRFKDMLTASFGSEIRKRNNNDIDEDTAKGFLAELI